MAFMTAIMGVVVSGAQRRAVGGISERRGLEVVHHRVALDVIAGIEQEGAVRVIGTFLFDQGCQLGIANIGALVQVAMRVVVVQDCQRDDLPHRCHRRRG